MSLYPTQNQANYSCYILLALLLSLPTKAFATELNVVLAEQEQQLLLIAEQKRQLQNLNALLPTLQELTRYPQATVELMLENMPLGRLSGTDKELLKDLINSLRPQPTAPAPVLAAPKPTSKQEPVQALNNLLPALLELAMYPQTAVDILLDDTSLVPVAQNEKQRLKDVINALRAHSVITELESEAIANVLDSVPSPVEPSQVSQEEEGQEKEQANLEAATGNKATKLASEPEAQDQAPSPAPTPAPPPTLSPVMALLGDQKDQRASRVVFQSTGDDAPIVAHLGETFTFYEGTYQLLAIDYDSTSGAVARFEIRLQTPEGIKTFRLPESL
jgi:hypothetical protein